MNRRHRTWTASVMFVIFSLSSTIGQAPDWWGTRGVTVAGVAADDYAAINQGQLKHLARAAWLEMEANLTGGAGPVVTGMVTGWQTPTSTTDDYAAVTAGQLKAVAKPFYDRLLETGALPAGSSYPWSAPGLVADDYAVVNAGQAKALFAFPIEAQDPWVKLTAPAPGRAILLGRTVKLTASAGSPEGIVKVQFYAGGTMINHDLTAPYELTWVPTVAGDYVLSAKAVDGLGAVLESATVAFTVHADTDNDGMGDVWEVANGLTSTDDPLGDKDGDRVPNSWEYARGTAANAAVAAVYDAVVDAGKPTQAAIRRYRTLQEAYDSLPADPDYRSVVEVRRGTYEADLDAVTVRKKVAWIGQGFERSRGYGAALWVWTNSNCGIKVADETVFDRIIIDGGATVTGKETRPRPALVIKPAAGTPKVGLINCVVRHWHTRDTTAGVTGYDPASTGSILVLGGNLRLYHTTLYYSVGRNLGDTGWGNVIDNRAGSLLGGRNSIIWGFLDVSPAPVAVRDNFGVAASFGGKWTTIQGYSFSPLPNADPKLTAAGYLQHTLDGAGLLNPQLSSTVVIGQGTAVTGVLYDVRGQSRPAVSRDQGADEWVDADVDHLPDWWENYWFGGTTAQTRTGDPDGDGVNNLAEYHALSVPAALGNRNSPHARDSDGDGFTDDEELDNGSNPWDGLSMPPVQIQLISGTSQSAETDAILDDQLVVKVSQMNRLSGIPVTFTSASGATFWNMATGKWLPSLTLTSNSTGMASVQVKAPASAGAAAMKAAVAGGAAVNFQASVSAPSGGGNPTVPPENPEHFSVGWKFAGKHAQTTHFHWDPPWANAHVADVYVTGATPNSSIQVYSTLGDGEVHDGTPPPLAEVLAKGEFPEVLINSGPYPGVLNVGGGVRHSLPMDHTWNYNHTGIATGDLKGTFTYTFGWQNKVRLESNVELPAGYKVTVLPVVKTYDVGNFGGPQDPPPEMTWLEPITFEIPEGKKESLPVIVPLQDVALGKRVQVDLVSMKLAVDADRDGVISSYEPTSEEKPFRFWINNDDDPNTSGLPIYTATEQDEVSPPDIADWRSWPPSLGHLDGVRDLEDFARLHLSLPIEWVAKAKAGTCKIGFKWTDGEGARIRVYRAADPNGSWKYLSDPEEAKKQCETSYLNTLVDVKQSGASYLPDYYWDNIAETDKLCFLFEGCEAGKAKLNAVIQLDTGEEVVCAGLWVKILDVRSMFERAKVAPPYDEPVNIPNVWDEAPVPTLGWTMDPNEYEFEPDPDEKKHYIVLVHGWRMGYQETQTWARTTFKRLWHQGYKGRFAAFRWPTFSVDTHYTFSGRLTYNDSEYRAWLSAPAVAGFVNSLPSNYTRFLMAHSMGNVVAGAAFRAGMKDVSKYVMFNSAMAHMAYGTEVREFSERITPDTDLDPQTHALGLAKKFESIPVPTINFYLTDDFALGVWDLNQAVNKPDNIWGFFNSRAWQYWPNFPHDIYGQSLVHPPNLSSAGNKIWFDMTQGNATGGLSLAGGRVVTGLPESMGHVVQSRSKPAGAKNFQAGSVEESISMTNRFGFGTEHSAPWVWSIQRTFSCYGELLSKFELQFLEK